MHHPITLFLSLLWWPEENDADCTARVLVFFVLDGPRAQNRHSPSFLVRQLVRVDAVLAAQRRPEVFVPYRRRRSKDCLSTNDALVPEPLGTRFQSPASYLNRLPLLQDEIQPALFEYQDLVARLWELTMFSHCDARKRILCRCC